MIQEGEEWPEVIAPGAFNHLVGQKVPLTLFGNIVGEGTVGADGLITDVRIDAVDLCHLEEVGRTDGHIYLMPKKQD